MRRRKSKRISKVLLPAVCVIALCAGLTGCGGNATSDGNAITDDIENTGNGVSGNAVSGNAISSTATTHSFCTDTNLYYETYADEEDVFKSVFQVRLDGTNRKKLFTEDYDEYEQFLGVEDGWLYYDCREANPQKYICDTIYRMAIEKDSEGYDVVKKDKKELLVQAKNWESIKCLYMDSQYLFYTVHNKDNPVWKSDKLIKYDLRQKKEVYRQDYFEKIAHDPITIRRVGEVYILFDGINEKGYAQSVDGDAWKKVSDIGVYPPYLTQDESSIYYASCGLDGITKESEYIYDDEIMELFIQRKGSIYVYNDEKETCILNKEQLLQVVAESIGINGNTDAVDICDITELFVWNGRVYVQIEVGWNENESYHMQYLFISRGENETNFRYEQKMTEWMNSCGQTRTGVWKTENEEPEKIKVLKEHVVLNDAQCIAMVDGRVYVSGYDYKEDEGRLFCYDLESGAVQEVKKNDVLFYALYYDGSRDCFEDVYEEDDYTNDYVGYCCVPSFDKDGEGDFYETKKE